MSPEQREAFLEQVRRREAKATPGPWRWFGNTDFHDIYLATSRFGRQFVMQFRRWGMRGAQPVFSDGRKWRPDPASTMDFIAGEGMTPASEMPVYEVAPGATQRRDDRVYRADLAGIRNPDADFIAHSREDVRLLLEVIADLQSELRDAQAAPAGATQGAAL